MRILFVGTVLFSQEMLSHLLTMNVQIVGVCTAKTSAQNADYADLQPVCDRHGIELHPTADINCAATIDWIAERNPDIIFCFGWSRLLGKSLITLAPLGLVGYHPAALPSNRGRHPIIWALALGLKKTASTFFMMDDRADSGDILSQVDVDISEYDDASSLYQKIISSARGQLDLLVPSLMNGSETRIKQDDDKANYWRKRSAVDGQIDWRMPATGICNLVRALSHPYPGAHMLTSNGVVKVWKASLVQDVLPNAEPGKIIAIEGGQAIVRCGINAVRLIETDPELHPALGTYL